METAVRNPVRVLIGWDSRLDHLISLILSSFFLCTCLVGAGAVGCFYGSRLHLQEKNVFVSLVCRSNYTTIAQKGAVELRTRTFGDYSFAPEFVFPSIAAASEKGVIWDYVVVTTKALPDLGDDSIAIMPVVSPKSSIVLIQNGAGVEEPYRRRFGRDVPILSAVTIVSAEQVAHGVVVQNRWTRIHVGPYVEGRNVVGDSFGTASTKAFVQMLKDGGIRDAEACDERELQVVRWHKIAVN